MGRSPDTFGGGAGRGNQRVSPSRVSVFLIDSENSSYSKNMNLQLFLPHMVITLAFVGLFLEAKAAF